MFCLLAKSRRRLVAALVIFAGGAVSAQAQETKPYHLTLLGISSALTLPSGSGFAQATYTSDRHGSGLGADGSTAAGLGFGDLRSGFGGHVIAEITSFRDDFGDSGYLTFQGATRIRKAAVPTFVGVSAERLVAWGDATQEDPAVSLMVTSFPRTGGAMPVMLTGGLRLQRAAGGGGTGGTGGETDECDPEFDDCGYSPPATAAAVSGSAVAVGDYEFGLFGGVGIGLSAEWAASAAWNVDHAVFGVSYRPRLARNLNVSLSLVDPFEQVGNAHVAVTISYLFGQEF